MDVECATAPGQRVLMTADTVGGVWQYALELAGVLARRGDEILLATMGGEPTADQRREAAAIPGLELCASRYKLAWMADPWDDVERAGDWLLELAGEFRPDVVHLNDFSHGDLPWDAPVLMVGHSCVLSWWQAVHDEAAPSSWSRYHDRVRNGLYAADMVVAPTAAMLAALTRHYGPLPASRVIANGRRLDAVPARTREPMILAAGRLWDEAKNVAALANVAPRLPWPVCIAGESRHPDADRHDAGAHELPNVHMLGRLSSAELAGWFARAPIYALPARYEPFGLSALEAALSGCALVLGDIRSLREVWDDAALFVPPDDPDALEAALRSLIDNEPLRRYYADRAQRHAQRFTPEAMARGYCQAYGELLARRRPALSLAAGRPATAGVVP
jgi:glycogen(starch) synthase